MGAALDGVMSAGGHKHRQMVLGQAELMHCLTSFGDLLSVPRSKSITHGACIVVVTHRKWVGQSGSALGPWALVNECWVWCLPHLASYGDLLKVPSITLIHWE